MNHWGPAILHLWRKSKKLPSQTVGAHGDEKENNILLIQPPIPPARVALFDYDLTKWLLQRGANPNARCHFDITPLSIAAERASLRVIQLLFDFGASVRFGQPLHYAVRHERSDDILALFLRRGAPINQIMFQEHLPSFCHFKELGLGTPLHEAASTNNRRTFSFLLQNGADPTVENTIGQIPDAVRPPPHVSRI